MAFRLRQLLARGDHSAISRGDAWLQRAWDRPETERVKQAREDDRGVSKNPTAACNLRVRGFFSYRMVAARMGAAQRGRSALERWRAIVEDGL